MQEKPIQCSLEDEAEVVFINDAPLSGLDSRVGQIRSAEEVSEHTYVTMEYLETKNIFRLCTSDGETYEYQCSKEDLPVCINGLTGIFYCNGLGGLDFATIVEIFGKRVTGAFHCLKTSSKTFRQDLKQAPWFQKQGNVKNLLFNAIGDMTLMDVNEIGRMCTECWGEDCEVIMKGQYEEMEAESFWLGMWVND